MSWTRSSMLNCFNFFGVPHLASLIFFFYLVQGFEHTTSRLQTPLQAYIYKPNVKLLIHFPLLSLVFKEIFKFDFNSCLQSTLIENHKLKAASSKDGLTHSSGDASQDNLLCESIQVFIAIFKKNDRKQTKVRIRLNCVLTTYSLVIIVF